MEFLGFHYNYNCITFAQKNLKNHSYVSNCNNPSTWREQKDPA